MLWVGVRLTKYWLQTDRDDVTAIMGTLFSIGKLGIGSILLLKLGPAVGSWAVDAFAWLVTVVNSL
jgi:hypothetical protein